MRERLGHPVLEVLYQVAFEAGRETVEERRYISVGRARGVVAPRGGDQMLEGGVAGMMREARIEAFGGERVVAAQAGEPAEIEAGLRQVGIGRHRAAVGYDGLFFAAQALARAAEVVPGLCIRWIQRHGLVETRNGRIVALLFLAHVAQPVPGARVARVEREHALEREAGFVPALRVVVRVGFGQPVCGTACCASFHGSAILAPPAVRRQSFMESFFASSPRGLEQLLAAELGAFGARDVKHVPGGVAFAGDWKVCYAANLWSRLASRVLWRVAEFEYAGEGDLYEAARKVDWMRLFSVERTLRGERLGAEKPVGESRFRDPAHQGRGVRPLPRHRRQPAEHRPRQSRRARARFSRRNALRAVPGHLRRSAVTSAAGARARAKRRCARTSPRAS